MTKLPFRPNTVMFLVLAAWAMASVVPAQAQTSFEPAAPDTTQDDGHMLGMILTGTAVGTLGFLSGAVIGASLDNGMDEYSGLEEALLVGSIAGGLSLPLGVHIGNKKQGNLGHVMATSLAVGGVGWLIAWQINSGAILPVIPLAQLIFCIAVEETTTAAPPATEQGEILTASPIFINLAPTRDGMGLFIGGSF